MELQDNIKGKTSLIIGIAKDLLETKGDDKVGHLRRCQDKKIHANATIRHRRNTITNLKTENGTIISSHSGKEQLIWDSFKQRIGKSVYNGMLFDLPSLIVRQYSLTALESKFTTEEIDGIVRQLPNDKFPGPDGFSNEFIKKCWNHIKNDFYELYWAFQENNVCLQSVNSSLVTLVPKIQSPVCLSDFRPISLLNSSMKLITKLLANRLQEVIVPLIHKTSMAS